MNTGERTIEWLFNNQLQVDREWSIKTKTGFRWWADKNAQTIEVIGQVTVPGGASGYLVSVRTELVRSAFLDDRKMKLVNDLQSPFGSLAGIVYDSRGCALNLCSLVVVHDRIEQWMNLLISMAAVTQIWEARIIAPELAKILSAEEAISAHPEHGLRPEHDQMLDLIPTIVAPIGLRPCLWPASEFQEVFDNYVNRPPTLVANIDNTGFTVEFPYGNTSSLCRVMKNLSHPRYGNGLSVVQSFPYPHKSDTEGVKLALSMNEIELTQEPFGYGFGGYTYRGTILQFASFFPNILYKQGLLLNVFFSCQQRARELAVRLTGLDWAA